MYFLSVCWDLFILEFLIVEISIRNMSVMRNFCGNKVKVIICRLFIVFLFLMFIEFLCNIICGFND